MRVAFALACVFALSNGVAGSEPNWVPLNSTNAKAANAPEAGTAAAKAHMKSVPNAKIQVLSAPEQALLVAKHNLDRLASDQFAAQDPLDEFVGRDFTIEVVPTTSYKDGVLDIYLLADNIYPNENADISDAHRFENHPSVEIKPTVATHRGGYMGENAFGVKVAVSRIDLSDAVLMFVNRPDDSQYLVRVRAPGPQAKLLSQSARFVVAGQVSASDTRKVAGCDSRYSSPTIDAPYAGRNQTCWVAVELRSLSVIDKRSGRVLRVWTPDDPKASILNKPDPIDLALTP